MDCSPPGSSVHGIPQARILNWVAISFSRGSSLPRDRTQVYYIAGRRFNLHTTRETSPGPQLASFSGGKDSERRMRKQTSTVRWERRAWVRGPSERCPRQADFEEAALPAAALDQAGTAGSRTVPWSSKAAAGTLPNRTLGHLCRRSSWSWPGGACRAPRAEPGADGATEAWKPPGRRQS